MGFWKVVLAVIVAQFLMGGCFGLLNAINAQTRSQQLEQLLPSSQGYSF